MKNKGSISQKIKFPIIITNNIWSFLEVVQKEDSITTRPKSSMKSDPLLGCILIDSSGDLYIVCEIIDLGYTNSFFGFSFKFGRSIFVEIKVVYEENINLEELKNSCYSFINSNANQYEELDFNTDELKMSIKSSESFDDLILLMAASSGIGL